MKYLNKIASVFCTAALGLLTLTGCEGGDIYKVDSPDWLSQKIDSIENAKNSQNQEEQLVGMHEDVYTIGKTDFTSGFWTAFSKYYQVDDGQRWDAQFNLSINPDDNTYYKNFALVVTNDVDRGGTGYTEYGAFRFDYTGDSATYNSQWGNYLWFKYANSTQVMSPVDNKDAGLQQLGGKVTLTVDRTKPDTFRIKITNGTVTKTLLEPIHLPNLNSDPADKKIRCFLVPEGSYINFLASNVEPIGGYTSAADKNPLSMELHNVPKNVQLNTPLDSAMKGVSATVTFEEGVTKEVPASELYFVAVPDMDTEGEKTLVVIYNKTFKGESAASPISARATFNVSDMPVEIKVTEAPAHRKYYVYTSPATTGMTNRTLAFDPSGLQVTGTFKDGTERVMDNSTLTFSSVPATAGTHDVTISTSNGVSTTTRVRVEESASTFATPSPTVLGAEDNSTAWWGAHLNADVNVPQGETRQFSFTNYTSGANNWNNFCVVLRNSALAEYAVVRADNYGWGNGYSTAVNSGGQSDWAAWLAAMNGAKVNVWVTNVGNGTADVQAVMTGNDGKTYVQYYLGLSTVDVNDLNVDFTVDNCHLVFSNTAFGKRHYAPRHYAPRHRR